MTNPVISDASSASKARYKNFRNTLFSIPPKRLRRLIVPVAGNGLNSGRMILLSSP